MLTEKNDFTEWLEAGAERHDDFQFACRLILKDGTSLSVQASEFHYCSPRITTDYSQYSSFEIGFPSREIKELNQFAEDQSSKTETVYAYVPSDLVRSVINSCGGVSALWKNGAVVEIENANK